MTKQEVMTTLLECSERLGRVPSLPELTRMSTVNRRMVRKHFGSYAGALSECNLVRSGAGYKVEMADLFQDWAGIARKLNKLPSLNEYVARSRYSPTPFMARYGVWSQVPPNMKRYIEETGAAEGWAGEWNDVLMMIGTQEQAETEKARLYGQVGRPRREWPVLVNQPVFGPILFGSTLAGQQTRPVLMIHGPVNEAGVIYLFGTMAEELGFVVTRMQTDYPDCEAMRRIEGGRWQRVRIEFEYESRNFVKHGHDESGCDLIVCWVNNWPECPVEVLELSRETMQIV